MAPGSRETPDPWWVTGLVETEGSFAAEQQGRHFALSFSLRVREENLPLVESLFAFFGVGRIYDTARGSLFKVTQTEELEELVEHFDRHPLRGPKAAVFRVWREMVLLKKGAFRNAPTEALVALAAELRAARQTSTRTSTPDGPRVTRRKR